ncbi:MAG: orotidine-5'-phosphate decarboxylase [Candidatus Micrarchaeota archaeon]
MDFLEKLRQAKKSKASALCVGLDPASIFFKETDSIPRHYFEKNGEADGMLEFCLDIVEKTAPHAAAFKPNAQYVMPFSLAQMQKLNKKIAESGSLSIYDLKLSDIGSTNESAAYWMKKAGFDAFTFSPFAGNVEETVGMAHKSGLGVIVLALMSNPEAKFFMRESIVDNRKGYEWICSEAARTGADGVVAGATNDGSELADIREMIGQDTLMLIPGIGKQGGSLEALAKAGKNVLINVGRSLIYADDPAKAAADYKRKFNEVLPSR